MRVSVNSEPGSPMDNKFVQMLKQRHTQLQRQPGSLDQQVVPANNLITRVHGSFNVHQVPNNYHVPSNQHAPPRSLQQMSINQHVPSNHNDTPRPYNTLPSSQHAPPRFLQQMSTNQHGPSNHNDPPKPYTTLPSSQQDDAGAYEHKLVQFPSQYNGILTYFQANNRPDLNLWTGNFPRENPKNVEVYTRNPGAIYKNSTEQINVPSYTIFPSNEGHFDDTVKPTKKRYKTRIIKFQNNPNSQDMFVTKGNNAVLQESDDRTNSYRDVLPDVVPRHKSIKNVQVNSNTDDTDYKEPEAQGSTRGTQKTTGRDTIEEYHKKWKTKNQSESPSNHSFRSKLNNVGKHEEPPAQTQLNQESETIQTKKKVQNDSDDHNEDDHMKKIQSLIKDVTNGLGANSSIFQVNTVKKEQSNKKIKKTNKRDQSGTGERRKKVHKPKIIQQNGQNKKTTADKNVKASHGREYKQLNRSKYSKVTETPNDIDPQIGFFPVNRNPPWPVYSTPYNHEFTKVIGMKNINPTRPQATINPTLSMGNTYTKNILGDNGYSMVLLKDKNNNYRTITNNKRHKKNAKVIKVKRKTKRNNPKEYKIPNPEGHHYENVTKIQNMKNTEITHNRTTKRRPEKSKLTKAVKIKKSPPNKQSSRKNNLEAWIKSKSILYHANQPEPLTNVTDTTTAGTESVINDSKPSQSRFPQVAYKVNRNNDGTYETASFQDLDNTNQEKQDYDEDDPEREDSDIERERQENSRGARMIEVDPEVVDDNVEDVQLREEDEQENEKIRDQDRADDEENQENDNFEDDEVKSDMEFDRIKESIDRIDEEPDDEEALQSEEEETMFTPEDYEEEDDDQDHEQSKNKDKKYVLMPFFLKVPKQRNKRSAIIETDDISKSIKYDTLLLETNSLHNVLKTRSKRKTSPTEDRKETLNQKPLDKLNKWQIPIFVIGSEEKESKDNIQPKKEAENKKRYSSINFNPFLKDNTFVKAETEFNKESKKAMHAQKKEDEKKLMDKTKKNTLSSVEGLSSKLKLDRNSPLNRLKYYNNDLKNIPSDEMYDKNATEVREKRKMFVLNKNFESATNQNMNQNKEAKSNEDELEKEKGLINRINTYTYVQMGSHPSKPIKLDLTKRVPNTMIAKRINMTNTIKTNFKPNYISPVKRSDSNYIDEAEEIKRVEQINKYMDQNNKMKTNPLNYTNTRRKFSVYAQPEQSFFLKKDHLDKERRQSIPVSERSDEEGFAKQGNVFLPRKNLHKELKTKTEIRSNNEDISISPREQESRLQVGQIRPKIRSTQENKQKHSEKKISNFDTTKKVDEQLRSKVDFILPKTKVEAVNESKQDRSSSEEIPLRQEIKKSEPEPVSPNERKNFRKYSKKKVKEVVIKSASEEPIVRTTVKITDESSKYPTLSKTQHKKRPTSKNNEKETITNHVKYERKVKQNMGNIPNSIFNEMDYTKSDSIESQESKIHTDIDRSTSSSINTYKIANVKANERTIEQANSKDQLDKTPFEVTTLSSLETNSAPKYYKAIIQETVSEDSPKTTYYEEIDYRTTMNPNFVKHAQEIRDSVGVPHVNYFDDKMVVTNYTTAKNYDDVSPENVYDEIFGKKYNESNNRNPLFDIKGNSHMDDYEHQIQTPDIHPVRQTDQKVNENAHNEAFDYHPENTENSTNLENSNPHNAIQYFYPTDVTSHQQNDTHWHETVDDNHEHELLYTTTEMPLLIDDNYEQYTTTEQPHFELMEEYQTENLKNHNVERNNAVYPDKQDQYYSNVDDIKATADENASLQDTLAYMNNINTNSKETKGEETPTEYVDEGGPRVNYYEEDKKYVSESKKIKENIPDDQSGDEEEDDENISENKDYYNG